MAIIKVFTVTELSAGNKKQIEAFFRDKHKGEEVTFAYAIKPDILGGILVVDDGKYYDATLKTQLIKVKDSMEEATAGAAGTFGSVFETVKQFRPAYDVSKAGTITYNGDGIIKVADLADVRNGELLQTEDGVMAIALNLEEEESGAILLGDEQNVKIGQTVYCTGRIVEVPVGDNVLGRVVNPLGLPLDGLGEIVTDKFRPIEAPAPSIMERGKVNTPLQTGLLAVDSMIPIGRGQRELIIGDRQTGKTAIAVDTIINQKGKNVICVYVAIGQKASSISGIINILKERGAMEYTVLVCSTAKDSAPLQYIAPYCGCAIAEEFMYQGKDVLIVYDDLSKHAVAYRAMSLLLKRPPGREAYPGDIFYLHSRLLERAAKLSDEKGGGSMTALPIVETLAGDISAYIPTNVISITDGQIYLENELFNAGIRPAVNVGLSVSRVGSTAQIKAMRKVSGKLRLDLSQYRELAIFAQFGSELDVTTQNMLSQGEKTTETLKQDQYSPYSVEEQVILLLVTSREFLKNIPNARILAFNSGLLEHIRTNHPEIIEDIEITHDLNSDTMHRIEEAANEYKDYFFRI